MEAESFVEIDSEGEFRTATPLFTSDDERFPNSPRQTGALRFGHVSPANALILAAGRKQKNLSRRKQRRFENDFFFWNDGHATLNITNPTVMSLCAQLEVLQLQEQLEDGIFLTLKKEEPKLYEAYVDGEDLSPFGKGSRSRKASDYVLVKSRKENGQASFSRIDRKIRQQMHRAIHFIRGIERVLLEESNDCGDFTEEIHREISSNKTVVIIALESPFHRMLAHGVAQFHVIVSKSVFAKDGTSKAVRFTLDRTFVPHTHLSSYLEGLEKAKVWQ
jgi:hypothetical protein